MGKKCLQKCSDFLLKKKNNKPKINKTTNQTNPNPKKWNVCFYCYWIIYLCVLILLLRCWRRDSFSHIWIVWYYLLSNQVLDTSLEMWNCKCLHTENQTWCKKENKQTTELQNFQGNMVEDSYRAIHFVAIRFWNAKIRNQGKLTSCINFWI